MTTKLTEKEREELIIVLASFNVNLDQKENDAYTKAVEAIEFLLEKKIEEVLDTSKVTRVEVINGYERDYVNWKNDNKVTLDFQDEKKTLKIFMNRGDI